jgi:hypothetical protein
MALLELIEKRADGDLARELLAYAAERLMAVEVEGLCGAGHGEGSLGRPNQRNGDRERSRAALSTGYPGGPDRARWQRRSRPPSSARARASPASWSRGACQLRWPLAGGSGQRPDGGEGAGGGHPSRAARSRSSPAGTMA